MPSSNERNAALRRQIMNTADAAGQAIVEPFTDAAQLPHGFFLGLLMAYYEEPLREAEILGYWHLVRQEFRDNWGAQGLFQAEHGWYTEFGNLTLGPFSFIVPCGEIGAPTIIELGRGDEGVHPSEPHSDEYAGDDERADTSELYSDEYEGGDERTHRSEAHGEEYADGTSGTKELWVAYDEYDVGFHSHIGDDGYWTGGDVIEREDNETMPYGHDYSYYEEGNDRDDRPELPLLFAVMTR